MRNLLLLGLPAGGLVVFLNNWKLTFHTYDLREIIVRELFLKRRKGKGKNLWSCSSVNTSST